MNITPKLLRVEGWKGISHSYALVNQFQLLSFYKQGTAVIDHIDIPFIMSHWGSSHNFAGFSELDQKILEEFSAPIQAQAVYRIFAPLELVTHEILPTITFAVTEIGLDTNRYPQNFAIDYATRGGLIHTPSHWSKQRLLANGVPEEIINVVPHAADKNYFYPMSPQEISLNRKNMGFDDNDVILLNVGTHHWNKGLDVLIKSFVIARANNKQLKLVLKDQRSTYLMDSEAYINNILSELGFSDSDLMASIRVISGHLNLAQLNSLYNAADAYVTPYRAEGFNLPALEAQSCGTPVVATLGGATDDFLMGEAYYPVEGILIQNTNFQEHMQVNAYIEPSLDHLVNTLNCLGRKKIISLNPIAMDWRDVCNQLLSLLK